MVTTTPGRQEVVAQRRSPFGIPYGDASHGCQRRRGSRGFLRAVFGGVGEVQADRPAEVHIGDSLVMVTSAGERDLFPSFLYVYVEDADSAYQRAIAAGATSIEPPLDTPYGDRRAMVERS